MENLVTITTLFNRHEAHFIKSKIEQAGIEVYLAESIQDNDRTENHEKTPLMVQVKAGDVERVIPLLFLVKNEMKDLGTKGFSLSHRILVPVDFSKNSFTACLFAFSLARNFGAEIKLLHIYNDPFIDSGYISSRISFDKYERNVLLEIEDMARRNMVAFVQLLQTELQKYSIQNINFHYNIIKGKPEYHIISLADFYNPFMIVLGNQGTGKMLNDIIGSVATRVIENTTVPVLAIPENWQYKSFDKINVLYATDFHDSDFSAFNNLLKILKPFNVHFDCIHIESNENHPWKDMQMFKLESYLGKTYPGMNIKCHLINHKNLLKGIQEFVDEKDIDLISFTSPKRSIFYKLVNPNNLKKMVYQSKIPLLIFHTELEKNGNE